MVCTGNAARSPMAAAMLRRLDTAGRLEVRSAGTLVVEGHPVGTRTRTALARHGLNEHAHRSQQFRQADAAAADLVVVMEPQHLEWMRRNIPEAAPKTGSLPRLARDLEFPEAGDLPQRVSALGLAELVPEPWEEVVDPGSGTQKDFNHCSNELLELVSHLHQRLI